MKVIIKYPTALQNAVVELHDVDNYDDAWDLMDEAAQQFGIGVILTNEEFQSIISQGTIDTPTIFKN